MTKTQSTLEKASLKGNEQEKEEKVGSCYGCGKFGHYKSECLELAKDKGKSNSNRNSRGRRAYIALEEDDTTSLLSNTENDEVAKKKFMGHVKKKKNEVTYSNSESEFNPSYEKLQQAL